MVTNQEGLKMKILGKILIALMVILLVVVITTTSQMKFQNLWVSEDTHTMESRAPEYVDWKRHLVEDMEKNNVTTLSITRNSDGSYKFQTYIKNTFPTTQTYSWE